MNELISIIIPVYNAEKYFVEMIQSVLSQSYKNIEILLLNDGSTDNSLSLCYKYQEMDNRIRVFDNENHGAAFERNLGIKNAKGEYIAFVDADDIVHPDYILHLYTLLKEYDVDMSMATTMRAVKLYEERVYTAIELIDLLINQYSTGLISPVCKLYKKEVFKDVTYPNGKINEDEFVAHRIFINCQKSFICNKRLYSYTLSETSVTHTKFHLKNWDSCFAMRDRVKFIAKMVPNIEILPLVYSYLDLYKQNLLKQKEILGGVKTKEQRKTIAPYKKFYRKCLLKVLFSGNYSVYSKGELIKSYFNALFKPYK